MPLRLWNWICAGWCITLLTQWLGDWYIVIYINTLRPRQNGRRFADDTSKRIFLNENVRISIKISLKFVPKGPINNNPALVQIMAWRLSGDKPLSEPMMVNLLTHICVTRPQWVKGGYVEQTILHCSISVFNGFSFSNILFVVITSLQGIVTWWLVKCMHFF